MRGMFVGRGLGTLELALALTLTAGCQIVFGIDEFEPSGAGEGSTSSGAGSASGGVGGEGAGGGEGGSGATGPTAGGGGTGAGSTGYVRLVDSGAVGTPIPVTCNGGSVVTLFGGAVDAGCSDCISTPVGTSCQSTLLCGGDAACQAGVTVNAGTDCAPMPDAATCIASPPSGAECTAPTASAVTGSAGLPTWAAFCTTDVAQADCILLDGVGECSEPFPHAQVMYDDADGVGVCGECTVQAVCVNENEPYGVGWAANIGGTIFCTGDTCGEGVSSSCVDPLTVVRCARRQIRTDCSITKPEVQITRSGSPRSLCCKSPLDPALGT